MPTMQGLKAKCRGGARLGAKVAKTMLIPSIVSFFGWSAFVHLFSGAWSYISLQSHHAFLCDIPAESLGCANCTDTILMCGKGVTEAGRCWQQAMNLTLKSLALSKEMKADFLAAAIDQQCSILVGTASDPVDMLESIIIQGQKTPGVPSDACSDFHCRVLITAYTNPDLTGVPGSCPNNGFAKRPEELGTCPCNNLPLTAAKFSELKSLCEPLKTYFPRWFMADVMNEQTDVCFRTTVSAAGKLSVPLYDIMAANIDCTRLIEMRDVTSVQQWFSKTVDVGPPPLIIPMQCKAIMCNAFLDSLPAADFGPGPNAAVCNWNVKSSLTMITWGTVNQIVKDCTGQFPLLGDANKIVDRICKGVVQASGNPDFDASDIAPICGNKTATPATDPAASNDPAGGATSRLLSDADAEEAALDEMQLWTAGQLEVLDAMDAGMWDRRLTDDDSAAPALNLVSRESEALDDVPPVQLLPGDEAEVVDSPAVLEALISSAATLEVMPMSRARRRLQDAAADGSSGGTTAASSAAAMEDKYEDYVTSDWSNCICYQQCVNGVQKRKVTCPDGSKCKTIVPPSARSCMCTHCSNCQVNMFLLIISGLYAFQGLCALGAFLCFLMLANYDEDDFTSTGYCTKCLGFLCKALPFLVRVFTFNTLVMLGVIALHALTPDFQPDCSESWALLYQLAVVASLWIIMSLIGRYMHGNTAMPPWLYYRARGKLVRVLFGPCRRCGP
eukprot:TRINITY_DN111309_c0_g1_i1.p1 TRINITY_DN111309_c0_g1~~TRINITY_DN111309_c0_g1_i1.p1  ORF type:complete len:729 (-),score=145.68 TRINITY_DN111309_c0_g1_i1:231-2417(-)